MRKGLQRSIVCVALSAGFGERAVASDDLTRTQIDLTRALARGVSLVANAQDKVDLRQAARSLGRTARVGSTLLSLKEAAPGIDKSVARTEAAFEGVVRLGGWTLGPGGKAATNWIAPLVGQFAGSQRRLYLEGKQSDQDWEKLLQSTSSAQKLDAIQSATHKLTMADPRNHPVTKLNPNGYDNIGSGNFTGFIARHGSSSPAPSPSTLGVPNASAAQPLPEAKSPTRLSGLNNQSSPTTSVPRPLEWHTLTGSDPSARGTGGASPTATAKPQSSAPISSNPAPKSTTPASGSTPAVGGVRTGSSSPVVSATALPEGGVRVAPSQPPSANGSLTQPSGSGATSTNLNGGVRTGSSTPSVSATALPGGGVRVAPTANQNQLSTSPAGGVAASYNLPTPTPNRSSTAAPAQVGARATAVQSAPSAAVGDVSRQAGSYNVALATPSSPAQAAGGGPGGISLSRAAAQRLSLNFDFDSASFADGRIVLSGKPVQSGIDAAMLLTTLRLACEAGDPSFSLDADNGQAWTDEGQKLAEIFGARLQQRAPQGLRIQLFSAKQHYGSQWQKLLTAYPNFKTRLVFEPAWLKDTRVGDVLYKADVLLKELVAGTPLLRNEQKLRAASVSKYVPSQSRRAARLLLEYVDNSNKSNDREWRGNRLWFDLVAQQSADAVDLKNQESSSPLFAEPRTGPGRTLLTLLREREYAPSQNLPFFKTSLVAESGNALDLSQVYPQMFVRRFDQASRKDLPGNEADLDLLAADVNQRTEQYAAAYKELRELTDIFRAYVIASKYIKRYPSACAQIKKMPLVDGEKPDSPLPEFHPSELFITQASYSRGRQVTVASAISTSGGIALRGKAFAEQSTAINRSTPITLELRQEVDSNSHLDAWKAASGRQFVALKIGPDDAEAAIHKAPVVTPVETPKISGTIGRFEIYKSARISGTGLKSQTLTAAALDSRLAAEECAKICSADANCVAFEIDEKQNRCQTFSTVSGARHEPNWTHGIWR
jgi:hypothetical protein